MMLERSAGLRSCRDLWAACHWQDLSRKGTDVTRLMDSKPSLTGTVKFSTHLTDELAMAQAEFTREVSGRVGMKLGWLDSQCRPTAPKEREVRTRAGVEGPRASRVGPRSPRCLELPGRGGGL